MSEMKRFTDCQRVVVNRSDGTPIEPTPGVVVRLRRQDDGAWIRLEKRVAGGVHPFPEGDPRENYVLAYPEECSRA